MLTSERSTKLIKIAKNLSHFTERAFNGWDIGLYHNKNRNFFFCQVKKFAIFAAEFRPRRQELCKFLIRFYQSVSFG